MMPAGFHAQLLVITVISRSPLSPGVCYRSCCMPDACRPTVDSGQRRTCDMCLFVPSSVCNSDCG